MRCLYVIEVHDFERLYVYCILYVYIIGMYCIPHIIEIYGGHDTEV